MDAAAWGTWAAVFVALAISLRDIIEKFFQRKAEAKILATLIYSDLLTLSVRVREIVGRIPKGEREFQQFEAILATNREDRRILGELEGGLTSPVLDRSIDRLFALPKDFSQSIAHVIASVWELRDTLASIRDEESNDEARKHYGKLLPILASHVTVANARIDEALVRCHKLIPTTTTTTKTSAN